MNVEVPPIVETQLTGYIGAGSVMRQRGTVTYRVALYQGRAPECTRNGKPVALIDRTMLALIRECRNFFRC